jgi:hypothetical protein
MTPYRFIRILDRLLRHMERANRRFEPARAQDRRLAAQQEAEISSLKTLLEAPENRDRPN